MNITGWESGSMLWRKQPNTRLCRIGFAPERISCFVYDEDKRIVFDACVINSHNDVKLLPVDLRQIRQYRIECVAAILPILCSSVSLFVGLIICASTTTAYQSLNHKQIQSIRLRQHPESYRTLSLQWIVDCEFIIIIYVEKDCSCFGCRRRQSIQSHCPWTSVASRIPFQWQQ